MHQILLHLEAPVSAQITANGARCGGGRVRCPGQRAKALDHPVARDADGDNRTGLHELDQGLVEGLALMFGVVLREEVAIGLHQFDVDEGVPLRLDPAQETTKVMGVLDTMVDGVPFDSVAVERRR